MESTDVANASKQKACLVDEMEFNFTLPILNDGKTESYVKLSKIMLIVQVTDNRYRNCVTKLKEKYKQICAVCPDRNTSSLVTFQQNFGNKSEEEKKHTIRRQVRQKCQNGTNLVIINCALRLEDMRYFFDISKEMGYVILFDPWKLDKNAVQQLCGRATSSLLNGSLVNHLFFAWFLNERDSLALREECVMYIKDCVGEVKEFESMLQRCEALPNLPSYFQFCQGAIEQDLVYCAIKFCGNNYVSSDKTISQLTARGFYGRVAKLKVFGFIVTPFAIGAKVKLTYKQKELIDRHCNVDMCTYRERRRMFCERSSHKSCSGEMQVCYSHCESTLETFVDRYHNPEKPYSRRGEISVVTLGYVKSKTQHNASQELLDAVSRELNVLTKDTVVESWSIRRSVVSRYGKCWMINLRDILSVDALLSSEIAVKSFVKCEYHRKT